VTAAAETPVLIVGGGPVGLALAADLGWRGIPCTLVEQGDGTIYHPRANTVNSRTMEFCRRWGIAEKVRNSGAPPDFPLDIIYCTRLQGGYAIARIDRPTYGGHKPLPTTPERSQRCNQLFFDPIMRELAASFPSVTLRYRCRFDTFTETADGVLAEVEDLATGKRESIAARYLVACCAGRSSVPRALGVRWEGEPVLSYNLNVFLRIKELWTRHDKGKAAFYFFVDPEGDGPSLIELDGDELWRLGIRTGRTLVPPESVDIDAIVKEYLGPDVPYEVVSNLPWTCRSVVADCWHKGPAFLAGDAVHQHSPSGGFGMNTGLGDAVDLGWKLEAMLRGWGGAGLLDSYEIERKPVARRIVREATENQAELADPATLALVRDPTPEGDRARAQVRDEIVRNRTKVFISDGIVLGARYDPSPIVVADGTPAPAESVSQYVPTARPGSRAPHAWLTEGRSTIDLFGKGFVLLAFGGAAGEAEGLAKAARQRGVPLAVESIGDDAIARLYERRLVLVRPDGYVAWRGDGAPADPLATVDRVRGAGN
jgi:2-polyprenyl-6-methoxyphenol hydroxylase-like FAD-dependent oxidoreductase